jgi:hypothetical protein
LARFFAGAFFAVRFLEDFLAAFLGERFFAAFFAATLPPE